jgi:2-dehydro-3-deoxyphosphogluconate aldolase/(4S)-4-hydroxy-2-oxoglutarate aldolase
LLSALTSTAIPWLPGILTPSEVITALEAGARAVKLFPAGTVGPAYIRQLRGPFPGLEVVPSGGVDAGSASEWLAAGAAAVGLSLVDSSDMERSDWTAVAHKARTALEAVTQQRER